VTDRYLIRFQMEYTELYIEKAISRQDVVEGERSCVVSVIWTDIAE